MSTLGVVPVGGVGPGMIGGGGGGAGVVALVMAVDKVTGPLIAVGVSTGGLLAVFAGGVAAVATGFDVSVAVVSEFCTVVVVPR